MSGKHRSSRSGRSRTRSRSRSCDPRALRPRTTTRAGAGESGNNPPYQSLNDSQISNYNSNNTSFDAMLNAVTGGDELNTSVSTMNTTLLERERERQELHEAAMQGNPGDPEGVTLPEDYPTWLRDSVTDDGVNTTCSTNSNSFDSHHDFGLNSSVEEEEKEEEGAVVPRPPGAGPNRAGFPSRSGSRVYRPSQTQNQHRRGRSRSNSRHGRRSASGRSSHNSKNIGDNKKKLHHKSVSTASDSSDSNDDSRASTTSTLRFGCWNRGSNWLLCSAILLVSSALFFTAIIAMNMYPKNNSNSDTSSNALLDGANGSNMPPVTTEDDDLGMLISVEQLSTEVPTPAPTPKMIRGTKSPTSVPSTMAPTSGPSVAPTPGPSVAPTPGPSVAPTPKFVDMADSKYFPFLEEVVEDANILMNVTTPQGQALAWLESTDQFELDILEYDEETDSDARKNSMLRNLYQRFALVTLDYALHGDDDVNGTEAALTSRTVDGIPVPKIALHLAHVCMWTGIACNAQREVTGVNWARKNLTGFIPQELSLLTNVVSLDLAQNQLKGTLDPFYKLEALRDLYVFENQLTGPLKEDIQACTNLTKFMAGHNKLTGPLPALNTRSINWFVVHHNSFSGQIPANLSLPIAKMFDISSNQISGEIPSNFVEDIVPNIRHLDLGNNQLNGTVPGDFANLGKGRVLQIYLNDNQLTGAFPTAFSEVKNLNNLDLSNNLFTSRLGKMCDLSVFAYGELVELRADCRICNCKRLCRTCYDNIGFLYSYDDDWSFDDDSLLDDAAFLDDDDALGDDDGDDDDTGITVTGQLNIINGDDDDDDDTAPNPAPVSRPPPTQEEDDDDAWRPLSTPRPRPAANPAPRPQQRPEEDNDDRFTVTSEVVFFNNPAPRPAPRPAPIPDPENGFFMNNNQNMVNNNNNNNNGDEEGFNFGSDGDDNMFFQDGN